MLGSKRISLDQRGGETDFENSARFIKMLGEPLRCIDALRKMVAGNQRGRRPRSQHKMEATKSDLHAYGLSAIDVARYIGFVFPELFDFTA